MYHSDGYHQLYLHSLPSIEWEEAFKNVMIRNTRQVEEQVLQQQHLQLQQQHHHQQVLQQQEEFLRMHEFHKRNNLVNNMGIAHTNGLPAGKYIRRKAQSLESLHFNPIVLNHF